jgi:aminoglycoside phosphotransferase (APT) family kinase protein
MTMHADQLHVDTQTVRRLVEVQFPQWRGLPVTELRTHARDRERDLPDRLPWSVQTWLSGHDATVEDPAGSDAFAHDLVELIAGMRAADTRGRRFGGAGRGGHLPDHDEWLETCFRQSEDMLDVPLLRRIGAELRMLPEVDEDVMCHHDLIPPNLLVEDGRLTGVLDGGAFGPADPALDLVAAWHLLDETQRGILRRELGCGDVQWRRGMAWRSSRRWGWSGTTSGPTRR